MTDTKTLEVYLAYNEDGDCEADTDEAMANERLMENAGGYQVRMIKLTITVPVMTVPEAKIEVPAEGPPTVTVTA